MFLEINDISTGTLITEPLNVFSINYIYIKEEEGKKKLIYVLTNGIRKIEEFDTQSEVEEKLLAISNASMGGLVQKDTYGDFPDKGSKGSIYIAKDTGQTYYWDPETETYIKTGTAGRTGVYVYNGELPIAIGSTVTINKSDLTEIVPATVDYSDGSEVIGTNATVGLITTSTSSSVTIKIIPDMVIDSFQQYANEQALPQTGAPNILYFLQDKLEFRVWSATDSDYVELPTLQYAEIPEASVDNLGKIIQYIGATGNGYTKGYFYECVSGGGNPTVYSWVEVEVQNIPEYTIPLDVFDLTTSSSSNEIITALGGSDNFAKLKKAFKNNKEVIAIKKMGATSFTTAVKYMYFNMSNISEILKLEAVYTDYNSSTNYKRHFITLMGSSGTYQVSGVSVTDIATTELTGLLSNLNTTDKTNLVSAINEVNTNSVKKTGNETISGVKTFNSLPQSSVTPSNNNDLVNKSYVDLHIVQYSTMPIASSTNVGQIVQYIGTTTSQVPIYTNGYFYQCIDDPENLGTYIWSNINVQPAPDMSNYYTKGETDEMIDGIEDLIGDVNTVLASITTLPSMTTIAERLDDVVDVEEQVGE